MYNITVRDMYSAVYEHKLYDLVVSIINDIPLGYVTNNISETPHLIFDIADDDTPTMFELESIISEVSAHANDDTKILVHCYAGYSRSPAVAIILDIALNGSSIEEAYQNILRSVSKISPNNKIISLGDSILKLDGKLIQYNNKYKQSTQMVL